MTRSRILVVLGLCVALALPAAIHGAAQETAASATVERQKELAALDLEEILRLALAGDGPLPAYRNLGGGLHALSIALPESLGDGLRRESDDAVATEPAIASFVLLATGQQLTQPSSSSTLIHAALSNRNLVYNYWWVTLNLGSGRLTRRHTIKLTGPGGTKFNRNFTIGVNGNTIQINWFNPGFKVNNAGVYIETATVVDATGSPKVTSSYAQ
jgi:hypothetical protein